METACRDHASHAVAHRACAGVSERLRCARFCHLAMRTVSLLPFQLPTRIMCCRGSRSRPCASAYPLPRFPATHGAPRPPHRSSSRTRSTFPWSPSARLSLARPSPWGSRWCRDNTPPGLGRGGRGSGGAGDFTFGSAGAGGVRRRHEFEGGRGGGGGAAREGTPKLAPCEEQQPARQRTLQQQQQQRAAGRGGEERRRSHHADA